MLKIWNLTSHFLMENNENIDFQFTNIKEGIEKTIDWFIKNYNEVRK